MMVVSLFTIKCVRSNNMSNGRLKIGTDTNDLEAKRVIIAAGAWSTQISGGCIDPVPLDTERGYHVMFPNDARLLNRPVGLADAGLYISPLDERPPRCGHRRTRGTKCAT